MAATVGEAWIYWCRFEEVIAGDNAAKHLFVAIMWNTLNCFLRDRTSSTAICSQWNIYRWQGFEKKGPSAYERRSLTVICSLWLVTSHFIRLLEASSIQAREIFKRAIYFLIYLFIVFVVEHSWMVWCMKESKAPELVLFPKATYLHFSTDKFLWQRRKIHSDV